MLRTTLNNTEFEISAIAASLAMIEHAPIRSRYRPKFFEHEEQMISSSTAAANLRRPAASSSRLEPKPW